jgi:hypothetical protein
VVVPGDSYLEAYKTGQIIGKEITDSFPYITE